MTTNIYVGDALEVLRSLPDGFAQCSVTSPPYFGLRDYAHDGQIGLEETPEQYIAKLVSVFREVRRVLATDGTLWLNIGDSYASGGRTMRDYDAKLPARSLAPRARDAEGIKPKDLIGIPWMLAFALRADGWYLRQDIIWHKPNPMPESVRDRCTKAHEYIFLLSKSPRYFIDSEGLREAASGQIAGNVRPVKGSDRPDHRTRTGLHAFAERQRSKRDSFKRDGSKREQCLPGQSAGTHRPDREESNWDVSSRNRRSVWTVPTRPYRGAHFATFPPDLIEPCIRAGSRPGDTVLDPFLGSGTTALVSYRLGRHCTGIELNREYADLARRRVEAEGLMFADVKVAA